MVTLATRLADLTTRIATETKSLRTLINGNASNLGDLTTTAKANLVAAINELDADIAALAASAGATIDDASVASSSQTYSINKILDLIAVAKAAVKNDILNGAGAAYDTLVELQALLEGDAASIAAINAALGNRLRFDAAQALSAPAKAQGCANLGAAALADTGDLDTNFVTTFEAGLV